MLITTPEGRLVFLMQGFKDAPDFYQHAHKDLDAYRSSRGRVDAQDIPNLSAQEAFATGHELYARSTPRRRAALEARRRGARRDARACARAR